MSFQDNPPGTNPNISKVYDATASMCIFRALGLPVFFRRHYVRGLWANTKSCLVSWIVNV